MVNSRGGARAALGAGHLLPGIDVELVNTLIELYCKSLGPGFELDNSVFLYCPLPSCEYLLRIIYNSSFLTKYLYSFGPKWRRSCSTR